MYLKQSRPDDTTRRLSSLLYYDQPRAQRILDLIAGERHRFLVRYDDIDTTLVARHAAGAARMWRRYAYYAMVALLTVTAICILLRPNPFQLPFSPGQFILGLIGSVVGTLIVLWLVGLALSLVARFGPIKLEDPGRLRILTSWIIAVPVIIWSLFNLGSSFSTLYLASFAVFTVYLHQAYTAHHLLVSRFQSDRWDPAAMPDMDHELQAPIEEIANTAGAVNSTIYSGFTPFVGSGFIKASFRDALEVAPADLVDRDAINDGFRAANHNLPPHPSEVQIMASLIDSLQTLELPNFQARRWHFLHGLHIDSVLPAPDRTTGRPTGSIDGQSVVDGTISDEFARSYLWLSSAIWGGDVVFNTFVRLVPGPSGLFIEISHHVLPPIDKAAARSESEASREGLDLFAQMTLDAAKNVVDFPGSLKWFALHRFRWNRTRRRVEKQVAKHVPVDRGAEESIRDIFTTGKYDHYFQAMDGERYTSIINASILTKIDDSLRQSGWAIAGLRDVVQNLQNITIDNSTNISKSKFGDNATVTAGSSGSGASEKGLRK